MRRPKLNKLAVGVTGSFGSGKSTVSGMFRNLGAEVIDADKIARLLLRPGSPAYKRIVRAFGRGVLAKNNAIDRKKLSVAAFKNKRSLKILNKITHPQIIRLIKNRMKKAGARIVVVDAPLLIESGLHKAMDRIIVVKASLPRQIQRLKEKTTLNRRQILERLQSQIPLRAKARLADFIIDNSGSKRETQRQVKEIWKSLASGRGRA